MRYYRALLRLKQAVLNVPKALHNWVLRPLTLFALPPREYT
jgi:hypothetical protein